METFNVLEARNNLSALVARAEAGEEIVIARRGVPVARIVAYEAEPEQSMTGAEFAEWLARNIHPRGDRSAEDVEAQIREERDSWE